MAIIQISDPINSTSDPPKGGIFPNFSFKRGGNEVSEREGRGVCGGGIKRGGEEREKISDLRPLGGPIFWITGRVKSLNNSHPLLLVRRKENLVFIFGEA